MVIVFKEFRLYCCHSVTAFGSDHKCSRKHGHTYKIRVEVECELDPKTMIAIPFEQIEEAWQKKCGDLDHTDLNDKFGPNATTEVLAMFIQGQMSFEVQKPVNVIVQETESSGVVIRCNS